MHCTGNIKTDIPMSELATISKAMITSAAKALDIKENRLIDLMEVNKIMYRPGSGWMPYQNHIDAGRFGLKTRTINGCSYTHPRFTAKGISWLAKIIERD